MTTKANHTTQTDATTATQAVMLYDGLCILCRQTQQAIKFLDWFGQIERLDAQDSEMVERDFPELENEDILGEIYVRRRDGSWISGFFGMRYLMRLFPLGWLILPFLYLPGMNTVGPKVYGYIARRRYAINKMLGNECVDGVCKLNY